MKSLQSPILLVEASVFRTQDVLQNIGKHCNLNKQLKKVELLIKILNKVEIAICIHILYIISLVFNEKNLYLFDSFALIYRAYFAFQKASIH
jgi:hypothetical protein